MIEDRELVVGISGGSAFLAALCPEQINAGLVRRVHILIICGLPDPEKGSLRDATLF
jgi:hypothetical protein